ncbi:MAG: PKD domain-containing protein, partial [Arthrobacter sp.]
GTATATASPQAPAPTGPTAAFASSVDALRASFDASTTSAGTGGITTYAWDFGDGTTGAGRTPVHDYVTGGQYTVTLTVTDSSGLRDSVSQTIPVSNPAPVAAFTSSINGRSAAFSAEDAGTGATYSWDFGDGTSGTGLEPTRLYAVDGDYAVRLTVTAANGATASVTQSIRAANAAPVAAFTSVVSELSVAFDASGSTDVEGAPASYAWTFGDGSTGTGRTAAHTYTRAGTYTVTLTVTDSDGATAVQAGQIRIVSAVPLVYALDSYGRTSNSGWMTADQGGAYTHVGSLANFTVADGLGRLRLASAGAGLTTYLSSVNAVDTEVQVELGLDKAATGGGVYQSVFVRDIAGKGNYAAKIRYMSNGTVGVSLNRDDVYLVPQTTIAGLAYGPGDRLTVRVQATGTSPTTLRAKVWKTGEAEPVQWQLSATDSTQALQAPGRIGLNGYLSGSATNAPVTAFSDNLWAGQPRP